MQIDLDRTSSQPLYQQLASHIQQRIRSGALPPGTRLPTVRQLAEQLRITRLTAHSAYAELASGGWVEATVGRGTFVAEQDNMLPISPATELGREVTPRGVLNDILRMTQIPGLCSLAMSDPALESFPIREWQRATEEALSAGGPHLLGYATAQGDLELRAAICHDLHDRGITVGPDEVMITNGVSQGMALVIELLARPGDRVLVEQPTYLGLLNCLHMRGVQPIGVTIDEDGLQIDALEHAIREHRPAFIYTVPTFQNPSGVCLSPERRRMLLDVAARHHLMVVEDDIYGRLCYEGTAPPALKADDHVGNVIHLGSFSKSLMPALRMGYMVASTSFLRQAIAARQAYDLCSPLLTQRALALFLNHGWHAAHVRRSLPRYRERRDALLRAMEQHFPAGVFWTRPRGGFSCWISLPFGYSVTELYLAAIERGIAFAPGEVFSSLPSVRPHLRLSFSTQPTAQLTDAITTLGELLRERANRRIVPVAVQGDCVPLV